MIDELLVQRLLAEYCQLCDDGDLEGLIARFTLTRPSSSDVGRSRVTPGCADGSSETRRRSSVASTSGRSTDRLRRRPSGRAFRLRLPRDRRGRAESVDRRPLPRRAATGRRGLADPSASGDDARFVADRIVAYVWESNAAAKPGRRSSGVRRRAAGSAPPTRRAVRRARHPAVEVVMVVFSGEADPAEHLLGVLTGPSPLRPARALATMANIGGGSSPNRSRGRRLPRSQQHSPTQAKRWRTAWNIPIGLPNSARSIA